MMAFYERTAELEFIYYVKHCIVYFLLLEQKYLRNRKWFRQTTQTTVSIYISHIKNSTVSH